MGILKAILALISRLFGGASAESIARTNADATVAVARSNVVTAGMAHSAFWIVWLTFAFPLAAWFALVMVDTVFTFTWLSIPDLPPAIKPYATQIFDTVFYSGAGMGGATAVSRGLSGILGRR